MNETWYLLFYGTSVDGRGTPTYCGRTENKKLAKKYWDKWNGDPYTSISKVIAVTDVTYKNIIFDYEWNDYD